MEPFYRQQSGNGPALYSIEEWTRAWPNLTAGFTGRDGGVSRAPYHSLNMGLHVGDIPEYVVENRSRVADAIGISLASWTYGEQVHDCHIQVVEQEHAGRGTRSRADEFPCKDAFITREPGIVLAALFADCVPLYFVDPEHGAVGLAHGGWKGTVQDIAGQTIQAMGQEFGSRPEAIRSAIGPSIGACCYEVDQGLIAKVLQLTGLSGPPFFLPGAASGKYMLNLQEINKELMIKAGILPHHIEITKLCTGCNLSQFFSHRMENGLTGRMAAWIGWRKV